MAEALTRSF